MALTFGASSADRVDCGTSLPFWNQHTVLLWVYCTTRTSSRAICSKSNTRRLRLNGTTGNVEVIVTRSTFTSYITNNNPLATNQWKCLAYTFDAAGGAGEQVQIYHGDLQTSLVECTYGTASDGTGPISGANAQNVNIGNTVGSNLAFQGRIAVAMYWDRVLSLGELRAQQFRPRKTDGCELLLQLGFNGTGNQADWSGSGNHGTVITCTVAPHVPLGPAWGYDSGIPFTAAAAALLALSRSDTAALSVTDSSSLLSLTDRSDLAGVSLTEAVSVLGTLSRTDTPVVGLSETRSILSALSRADTTNLSLNEAVAVLAAFQRADSVGIAVSDTASLLALVLKSVADSLGISVSDASAVLLRVLVAVSDTASLSASDAMSIFSAFERGDTVGVSLTDSGQVSVRIAGTDDLTISIAELAELVQADVVVLRSVRGSLVLLPGPKAAMNMIPPPTALLTAVPAPKATLTEI